MDLQPRLLPIETGVDDDPFLDDKLRSDDSLPLRRAPADAIDLQKVTAHIERAAALGRLAERTAPIDYLIAQKCLVPHNGEIYSTAAGLVCFGKQPQAILPQAVVDIGHYRGTEAVSFDVIHLERNIGGTIFDQLARIEEYLWRNTHHGMTLSNRSLERVEIDEYPRAVIRELAVNMLVHRDYTITGSSSRIMFFRNRIEWISPGGLPPGINEDNLLYVQNARNPILRNILYQAGYVESFGQGLSTVVNVLKREDMAPPAFRDVGAAFIVTVFGRSLDTFDAMPAGPYNDAQRRIIVELRTRGELGFLDLREALSDRSDRSLQADIAGLIKANVIERIGKTRAVRYRLRDFRPPSSRQE